MGLFINDTLTASRAFGLETAKFKPRTFNESILDPTYVILRRWKMKTFKKSKINTKIIAAARVSPTISKGKALIAIPRVARNEMMRIFPRDDTLTHRLGRELQILPRSRIAYSVAAPPKARATMASVRKASNPSKR